MPFPTFAVVLSFGISLFKNTVSPASVDEPYPDDPLPGGGGGGGEVIGSMGESAPLPLFKKTHCQQ